MDTLKIGQIIEGVQNRDAVHMAIAPVTAAHRLSPGTQVGLAEDGTASLYATPIIGVIDPFLKGAVMEGERCWLFLYPGSITSLRHDWTHPAFAVTAPVASEEWLRKFADTNDVSYQDLIMAGRDGYLHTDGGFEVPPEFWLHWEAVTGEVASERVAYFSCSC